jgi:hypothetical protein
MKSRAQVAVRGRKYRGAVLAVAACHVMSSASATPGTRGRDVGALSEWRSEGHRGAATEKKKR